MTKAEIIEKIATQLAAKGTMSLKRARAAVRRLARGRTEAELMSWL